ncbi:hypothetical protein [Roseateles sp.]|uniref:helix-turn-helix transcriptional regulator n=1 Tax=Roseateles sp. TaxID=1971397 RepID=UPI0032679F13
MQPIQPEARRAVSRSVQPLNVLELPDALLRLETLALAAGMSVATLYRKAATGELPLVKIGKRCTRVRSADARAFIAAQGDAQ